MTQARLRLLGRWLLGPAAVATFAGVELRGNGTAVAAAGAYFVLAVTQISIDVWARWQLHRARHRLAVLRSERTRGEHSDPHRRSLTGRFDRKLSRLERACKPMPPSLGGVMRAQVFAVPPILRLPPFFLPQQGDVALECSGPPREWIECV